MNLLVLGASGGVGRWLTRFAADGGHAVTALVRPSASLDVLFTSSPVAVGQAENPNGKILAVSGKRRLKLLPRVPTFGESGVDVEQTQWLGILGPAGLPDAIRNKLSAVLVDIIRDGDTQTKLRNIGFEPLGEDHVAFDAFFRTEVKRWAEFVKENGLMEKP